MTLTQKELKDIIENNVGKDIHKIVASKLFNVPMEQVTDEQRKQAKNTLYMYLYSF